MFKIGDWVIVKAGAVSVLNYENENDRIISIRKVERVEYKKPLLGKITGATWKSEGEIKSGYDYEPAYLIVDKKVFVWTYRIGLLNKERYALEKDIELVEDHPEKLPRLYCGYSDEYKKNLSKESKKWPRDEKGRFIKEQ